MTQLSYRKCDACETTVLETEIGDWLNVRQVVGNAEAYIRMEERRAEVGDIVLDTGDFCSLACLANWASARATMKELDG